MKEIPLMEIYVNGRKQSWSHLSITYEQVIGLAYGVPYPGATYTISYIHGLDNSQGSMIEGDKIPTTMDMIFNVLVTAQS